MFRRAADVCERGGDPNGAGANRDSAATFRHISHLCIVYGKATTIKREPRVVLPVIEIAVHGTSRGPQ